MAAGLAGSALPGDCEVDIYIGQTKVGNLYNTTGGASTLPKRDDMFRMGVAVPSGTAVRVEVVNAAVTNAVTVAFDFDR